MTSAARRFPILEWAAGYQPAWLRFDVVAGLTAAAVVIPKAMAYATIAGLPVQVGLYTALLPMGIYALLGTSRPHDDSRHPGRGESGAGRTRR
jgi:sulfate permease, SulP family